MSVNRVVRAWVVEGPVPERHQKQKELLRQNWPELYLAMEELTNEYFSGKVKDK